ncbi:MAG: 1-deoxy-D-xylulose-5-phosphate synthase [Clostridiaceae bacterium]|jgi:1-deoxy-D-xylulose-5-phosphate synthase|nr:1-deoxy-D-xylulose-5-phosphate synthase [Clostridiaceae bacterium]
MDAYPLLSHIASPHDVGKLTDEQLESLCAEIRLFLVSSVSQTGGHLASNLGIVEIAAAVENVFCSPKDKIVYDVGHQCYVHKLLTGRRDEFHTLRQFGGLSGFPRPWESPHDAFVGGHASASVSAALGLARARTLRGEDSHVVCVIGDGAMTGGMAYEALNDAGQAGEPLIVIYNDNGMSISPNVGAVAKRLSRIRLKPQYIDLKSRTKAFFRHYQWGEEAIGWVSALKRRVKSAVLRPTIFELMGFTYLGPADGHDVKTVKYLLTEAKKLRRPVVLHFKTVKGKGYGPSERSPENFHGVAPFNVETGAPKKRSGQNFSAVMGSCLTEMASKDSRICAVTAAMEDGAGLSQFARAHPERFFDVGIAEEHAITMSGGLAAGGMKPVCCIYSTFLQRGYDQMIHDLAIGRLPAVIGVDRAGLVGEDGETHQGMFDVPYLLTIPHMEVLSPSSFAELRQALERALAREEGPTAIRYARGKEGAFTGNTFDKNQAVLRQGGDITLVSYGVMINEALAAADCLAQAGLEAEVVKLNSLTGFDQQVLVNSAAKTRRLAVIEDCCDAGCLAQRAEAALAQQGVTLTYCRRFNCGADFVPAGAVRQLYQLCGIDGRQAADCIQEAIGRG